MVKAYVADWKKDEVSQLQDFVKSADVVGLVDVSGIGAKQMLDMRASLRDLGVKLRMSRNRLLKRALEASSKDKKGVEQVIEALEPKQLALFSSTENPFLGSSSPIGGSSLIFSFSELTRVSVIGLKSNLPDNAIAITISGEETNA